MVTDVMQDPVRLTKIYIKMRDKKAEITAQAKAETDRIDEQMAVVEQQLLKLMGDNAAIRNDYGTVTKTIKEKFWSSDWDAMKSFALEYADEGGLDLFEKRLAQNNMKEFLQKHPGVVPRGLQIDRRYAVTVRRAQAKPGAEGHNTDNGEE